MIPSEFCDKSAQLLIQPLVLHDMEWPTPWYILIAAFILDLLFGDPETLPHPIRWMGKSITRLEPLFRIPSSHLIASGALFSILLISGTWGVTAAVIKLGTDLHPYLGIVFETVIIYYAISAQSLEKEAMRVFEALNGGSLEDARNRVSRIVGRDVDRLDASRVSQATVESVAESLVDGVISPLFFAWIGGAPLAMAYKMVNTLDSMIGHMDETYIHFGKTSAKIDDVANFFPARASVPVVSLCAHLLNRRGGEAFMTAIREGRLHLSPNSGFSEAAFSGALGIRLGGSSHYDGQPVDKPVIGKQFRLSRPADIRKACDLMLLSSVTWVSLISACSALF
ncbi:MAG: adenosylcobinamide-phosphate synthase CbiB [Thermodesulfobacteriota bacterium]